MQRFFVWGKLGRIFTGFISTVLILILSQTIALASIPEVKLDKSDNQPPVLVSFNFDYLEAQAGSELGLTLVMRDDKNQMVGLNGLTFSAPSGAGTLQKEEGRYLFDPRSQKLVSRVLGPGYIEETWRVKLKVPSLVGQWTALGIGIRDFGGNNGDLASVIILNVTNEKPKAQLDWEVKEKAEAEAKVKAEAEARAKIDAEFEAQDLADKPLCDSNKAELVRVRDSLNSYKKVNPKRRIEINSTVESLNSALDSKCVADITLLDFQREAQELIKSTSKKSATITCIKGKLIKKVSGTNPKCPKGYVKK
jgi:hypothetical protein